jgi:group I intron endonuclease
MTIRGIYAIVNTANGAAYVGSSIDIELRFRHHKNGLNKGEHHNVYLTRAWKRYGAEKFAFIILEEMPDASRSEMYAREQFWIDTLLDSYNISGVVDVPAPCYRTGWHHTEEVKQRIREQLLGRVFSEETLRRMRESNSKPWSEERWANYKSSAPRRMSKKIPRGESDPIMYCGHCNHHVGWWESYYGVRYLKHEAHGRGKSCGRKLTLEDIIVALQE